MRRPFAWPAAFVLVLSATATTPSITRDSLVELERKFDRRVLSYSPADPFDLLGTTRGVYLEDYGVVFTAELNLVAAAVITPFRPAFTKEQIAQLRLKKVDRLAHLKEMMRNMMIDSATSLKHIPGDRRIAVGVTLFRYSWENSTGLPAQILMEARLQNLRDFEAGKLDAAGLDAAISVREF